MTTPVSLITRDATLDDLSAQEQDSIIAEAQRRANSIVANMILSLAPTAVRRERYYPPISRKTHPELFSNCDDIQARRVIFERDNYTCIYCGASKDRTPDLQLAVDHIKPFNAGGSNSADNLVTACATCNSKKGGRELHPCKEAELFAEVRHRNALHQIADAMQFDALTKNRRKGGKRQ